MVTSLYTYPPKYLDTRLAARHTTSYALPSDPRASFYLYVPRAHPITRRAKGEDVGPDAAKPFPLVVLIHDSSRDAQIVRDAWATAAEEDGFVVLAPLFPTDLTYDDGGNNYKSLLSPDGTRFDNLLFAMIDLVNERWGCLETSKFYLAGFSGGAQFVHRFMYFHSDRVRAASIAAPGKTTPLIDKPWPTGIANVKELFGEEISPTHLASLSQHDLDIQLAIGVDDNVYSTLADGSLATKTRFDVLDDLARSFDNHKIRYERVNMPGVKHQSDRLREVVIPWMRQRISK